MEVRRGTNVFESREFFFSGLHSLNLATDGEVWHISGILPISGSPQALPNLRFIHSILKKSTFKVASREPQRSLEGASKEPQNLLATIFQQGFLSSSETIFLSNFARREPQRSLKICLPPYFNKDFFPAVKPYFEAPMRLL